MEMMAVQSSQISAIGHDGNSILRVLFKRGELYEYPDVDATLHAALMAGNVGNGEVSVGKFFNAHIRGRKEAKKITGQTTPVVEIQKTEPVTETALEVLPAAVEEVKQHSLELVDQAKAIVVSDVNSDREAKEMLLVVRTQSKQIDETFDPDIARWHAGHKAALAMKAKFKDPIAAADKYLCGQINEYALAERNRIRKEEESLRIQERQRADDEAKRESERLALDDAEKLASEGFMKEAEAVISHPLPIAPKYVAPAPVAPQVASVRGISKASITWDFRIVDEAKIPREYMTVNESAIRSVIQRTNAKILIPGVEAFEKASTAATTRRA